MTSARELIAIDRIPSFIHHLSFQDANAEMVYDPAAVLDFQNKNAAYMPDEITRECARRMHYAAFRWSRAKGSRASRLWKRHYLTWRDRIIVGNYKLVYRAVRRRFVTPRVAEDLLGECTVVFIKAVAAYNPWLGVRFSTYSFTCLLRAMHRLGQKVASDRLLRAVSLQDSGDAHLAEQTMSEPVSVGPPIDQYLREDHPLLSPREKVVLRNRFSMDPKAANPTLETVGRAMGLSKERVRQLQASALDKLRRALLGAPCWA